MNKNILVIEESCDSLTNPVPTQSQERINSLDVLRGFAVFGILIVNILAFAAPPHLLYVKLNWWTSPIDRLVEWLVFFFAVGKFYCLFSFLFGLGFAVQKLRAGENSKLTYRYIRRLLVLLVIGFLHTFLLWWGDILLTYALLGFLLVMFVDVSRKTLLITAFICLAIPIQLSSLETLVAGLSQSSPEAKEKTQVELKKLTSNYKELAQESINAYSKGSYKTIFNQRIEEVKLKYSRIVYVAPQIFAMFLLGLYVGQIGIFQNLKANLLLISKVMKWGLSFGIVSNLLFVISQELSNPLVPSILDIINTVSYGIGTFSLCFFYMAALLVLLQSKKWQRILAPFTAVGRLALSNYLLQSIICTTIFYSYGLALYGKVNPALSILLAIFIYIIQVFLSIWWIKRFYFGPMEWLWRSITYLKFQPMKKNKN